MVTHPLVLEALAQAAIKRRILAKTPAARLIEYGASCGVADTASLRIWLAKSDGLHPDLARKLLSLLPPSEIAPLGIYQPLTHLADGGMGSVWLASRADHSDLVVVKTIRPSPAEMTGAAAEEGLRRFARETRITRELNHHNVVRCLDSGVSEQGTKFLVLEYVDSGDLRDLVDAKGGLTEALALAIIYQVADGLAEANRVKLIHRDIKPPNIFVASNGNAKLADFGIARSTESTRTMLTMEGSIVGSPLYMSPEQIITDPTLDIRSDIYALGAVLYFCLAAEAPYGGRLQEILHQHCTAPVPDIRLKRPKLSQACHELITKAMTKDRNQRFQTPEELRGAIGKTLKQLGMHPEQTHDESTALRDFSAGTARHVARDIANLTANLRKESGLDEIDTIVESAPSAAQATLVVNLNVVDPQATIAAQLNVVDPLATITANLNTIDPNLTLTADLNRPPTTAVPIELSAYAERPNKPTEVGAMATMTAVLMAEEPSPPPLVPTKEPSTVATTRTEELGGAAAAPVFPIEGDPTTALAEPWLVLTPAPGQPEGADQPLVFLFAQPIVRMGKLRESPNDLCLRNYPVQVHKEACQRLSRQHLVLRYDAVERLCLLEDLNAPNGTRLDGIPVPAGKTYPLRSGVDNIVELAGVVVLWLRCLPRPRGWKPTPPGLTPGTVGLDSDYAFDAVVMTRPENRPELAYAQVLRRLTVGGPGAELTLAGARTRTAVELAIIGSRWLWRVAATPGDATTAWKPLTPTTTLDCGGRLLRAAPARHEQYG